MNTFRRDIQIAGMLSMAAVVLFAGAALCPASAQTRYESAYKIGHRIIYLESSIARPGSRHHTNYFFVDSDKLAPNPSPPGVETPGSVACVYKLVSWTDWPLRLPQAQPCQTVVLALLPSWTPVTTPPAQSDLDAFDSYYGIPAVTLTQTWPAVNPRPPVYPDWEVEEALDIEWAHAMAPHAKLFLVVSALLVQARITGATDPSWAAVQLAGNLVAQNGGGVVSMSFADAEIPGEINLDTNFTHAGVVYFAAAGDGGFGVSAYPAASPNVVAVGGTYFNRDGNGNFTYEQYYTGGGGEDISPYEPRPEKLSRMALPAL